MSAPFTFRRQGRSPRLAATVIGVYAVLIAVILVLEASPWIALLVIPATLPALWDLYANPTAGLDLTGDKIRWFSGKRSVEVPLKDIDSIRFDTRWDFSVRVTLLLKNGGKTRIPVDCLPPHQALETALTARDMAPVRHHFTVF